MTQRAIRIGLLGMYASANVGDTAIQEVVMAGLRARRPEIEFVGLSQDAEDVVRTHGIPAFPASGEGSLVSPGGPSAGGRLQSAHRPDQPKLARWLRAVGHIYRQMHALDMLIVSGGGQIDDFWGGAWHQPFRLLSWCASASLQGKPIAWFAVGVDDLGNRSSKWFVRSALRMSQHRTFRDYGSLSALRKMGLRVPASVCPDPAFGFLPNPSRTQSENDASNRFVVISPISKSAFQGVNDREYERYLTALAAAADALTEQGLRVRFGCSQTKMDPSVAARVMALMKTDSGDCLCDISTVNDFIGAVADAEFVVASRLHATILSFVAGVPVIAISPARKVTQQMKDLELEDYCLPMRSLRACALLAKAQNLLLERDALQERIARRVAELRAELEASFDQVAKLIDECRTT